MDSNAISEVMEIYEIDDRMNCTSTVSSYLSQGI